MPHLARAIRIIVALLPLLALRGAAEPSALPDPQVEFFGPERVYAVGSAEVPLVGVVRNRGAAPLPAGALRVHCYAESGLDYTSGDTRPLLPALAPGQAVAFRWKLSPSAANGAMVAGLLLRSAAPSPSADVPGGGAPWLGAGRATMVSIPRFGSDPQLLGASGASKPAPHAYARRSEAGVGNDRVWLKAAAAENRTPVLALSVRDGSLWRTCALTSRIGEVTACEDGQSPWAASFRWRTSTAHEEKGLATLTLSGTIGTLWRADLEFVSRQDTCVVECRLRLTAKRALRAFAVLPIQLQSTPEPREAAMNRADGSPLPAGPEPESLLGPGARLAVAHRDNSTFGISWPEAGPLADWRAATLPQGDSHYAPQLGAEWRPGERGDLILPETPITFSFRCFALVPSSALRDAERFAAP